MYRTHTCGELRMDNVGQHLTLAGWVQKNRDLGGMTFIDLRDRYGITQLVFNMETNAALCEEARKCGREFVIRVRGSVAERSNKNPKLPTGDIEILVDEISILNASDVPPFTIEDKSDGGDDLRMKYRYLDLRRNPLQKNIRLRHKMAKAVRDYLDDNEFVEVETPVLIKSTPEGARDFIVPSRMNEGQFYALPQSPQVFKQLLMISGYDRYFQIVKCFRDEDLRADRQPEFTQIDCEMAFVEQEDILTTFEGLASSLFKSILDLDISTPFLRMSWDQAMTEYGNDKPDLRFGMKIKEMTELVKGKGFPVFDQSEYVGAIKAENSSTYSRKQLDKLTDYVRRPQIGSKGLVYLKMNEDGSMKSSVDKFYPDEELRKWAELFDAKPGDLLLVLAGDEKQCLPALSELRLEMGRQLGLMNNGEFFPLWVVDFPLLEWDDESKRYHAMHHPFTSPKPEDMELLKTDPGKVRANAYDLVINGVEIGGGSIRIHNDELQQKMFDSLGFTKEEAQEQFGFLMNAFKYGAPPHGGVAFGFDRWVALFAGEDSIRDVIAFPKNNSGRDVMIDSPASVSTDQLDELKLNLKP
ncbi:MAG: aspartate--tRNA ligase [Bacteroidetes bacterium]|jgi:aspartyl-tRNA synthetase|nr:aspartate--tRNA ligase [Bacteroidota bacterium]MBT3747957.1 aspartate--tRNA ligase [Bacteroidota bacterium]MBT5425883.1 aspartate--tRNA ligase [Bacteroidota bacterium]MBT7464490.1 aspartate--tRNA ligase [Bacteroidota bacterium]